MPNNWVVDDIHELANDILLQSQGGDVSPDLSGYVGVYITGIDTEAFAAGNPIEIYSDINQIPEIKLLIVPKQEGSGTPSPTNVRPITGWNAFILSVNDTEKVITTGEAGTVYGGTLDITTGLLTVDIAIIDLGVLSWSYDSANTRFSTRISGIKTGYATRTVPLVCSALLAITDGRPIINVPDKSIYGAGASNYVYVVDHSYTDANTFKAAMSGVMLVYELETPTTYQLTPTEVNLIAGENVISTDSPNTLEVTYKIRS